MPRTNAPFYTWNRGLVSPKALGRVDLERTRLSAEVFENAIAATQGSLSIRPGTKYMGSTLSDTGAEFIEFVASTDDVALPELTHQKMRLWLGDDAHDLSLLSRPRVDTTVSLSDTGWSNASTGGGFAVTTTDAIPEMASAVNGSVDVSASSEWTSASRPAFRAADNLLGTNWQDTGTGKNSLPSWWLADFGTTKRIASYTIRCSDTPADLDNAPTAWTLQVNDVDTGAGWTTVDTRSGVTSWSVSEKKSYRRLDADTGTVEPFRFQRLNFTAVNGSGAELIIAEIEMLPLETTSQAQFNSGQLSLNASSVGAVAKATKRVILSDTGTEHSLAIRVARGPVVLRVGSTSGADDYISETSLGTGYHNLAFTPTTNFYITLQSNDIVDRIVSSLSIGDSGTVEITTPWDANDLSNIRYDQSADIVYVDCDGVKPHKIERRGTGRSWSAVEYAPIDGPFLPAASSSAKMSVSHFFGNTTLNADIPFFTADHVGALIRAFHNGQSGQWRLGALNAITDAIEVTGISDTGGGEGGERKVVVSVTGTWAGTIILERSFDGVDVGFHPVGENIMGGAPASDTGTFAKSIRDEDDNIKVWYRARVTAYTSGIAVVSLSYDGGGVTGTARITDYNSSTAVGIEVISRFSDTGPTENWQQGYWSDALGYPTAVALHGGRLSHAQGGSLFLTVADDYENFDEETEGDAGPIIRTLGSGPVDRIRYLVSLLRLIIGTAGAEITLRSSSLDEPVTPENSSAGTFSTQGSANIRAVKMDNRAIFVQRSGQRVFMVGAGAGTQGATFGDYEGLELTLLVPDLLAARVVSIAIQRQPDTRLHCVLADGTVAVLTYEPSEEVICWFNWSTDGFVERAAVLPGLSEDAVFYHIRRTINGLTKRFLEKWAKVSECTGDTGLSWLMDCARSYTDTGRTLALTDIATHLVGESVIAWGSLDTGSTPHVDLSPDVSGVQTTYVVDTGGDVTLTGLTQGVHHAVVGLPYSGTWKSTKLAYAAEAGSALAQKKRVDKIGLCLYQTHANGLFFGNDTGALDPLPRVVEGATVDQDAIHETLDQVAMAFPGLWHTDSRIVLRFKAPRPATVLAMVPTITTSERV